MMRLARRASLLVALSLLASAATAYAECAWVLWDQINMQSWTPSGGFPDEGQCRARLEKELDSSVSQYPGSRRVGDAADLETASGKLFVKFICLPDTVDPRGPKAK